MSSLPSRLAAKLKPITWRRITWGCVVLLILSMEFEAVADDDVIPGDSISETTRALLRTDTPVGRTIWYALWGTAAAWFASHIARSTLPSDGN